MGNRWPDRRVKPFYCETCAGWRPHVLSKSIDRDSNRKTRIIRCQVCSTPAEQPGIWCPVCAERRFKTVSVKHPRPGMTIRVKKCKTPGCLGEVREVSRKIRSAV